jgi:maltooligosyltrehalose trehalohydrolase
MLEVYRSLIELRRRLPDLTDPSFEHTRCTADEKSRLFTMHRGDVVVVVNFGAEPVTTQVGEGLTLLFETESGVDLSGTALTLPGHAGALLAP